MSSMKWNTFGALYIGLGKSFQGLLTWFKHTSISKQAIKDHVTLEMILLDVLWGVPSFPFHTT